MVHKQYLRSNPRGRTTGSYPKQPGLLHFPITLKRILGDVNFQLAILALLTEHGPAVIGQPKFRTSLDHPVHVSGTDFVVEVNYFRSFFQCNMLILVYSSNDSLFGFANKSPDPAKRRALGNLLYLYQMWIHMCHKIRIWKLFSNVLHAIPSGES